MSEWEIVCCSVYEDFELLEDSWDTLLHVTRKENIFLSHTWLRTWWRIHGGESEFLVLLAWRNHELVAATPLMIQRKKWGIRILSFIGEGELKPAHMGIICLPELRYVLIDQFVDQILGYSAHWDVRGSLKGHF